MLNEKLKLAIDALLREEFERADGTMVKGIAESRLPAALRDEGWKNVPKLNDLDLICHKLGFTLINAKAGKWTKGGYKYCQPARVWVKE
jgi:hypothetical protein